MEKARRRRVPAFGEWNYYYYSGEVATPAAAPAEWYAQALEPDARSDVWFRYSPPPRKPPPGSKEKRCASGGKRRVQATPARTSDAGARTTTAACIPEKAAPARVRVVRSVDADLYQVPPLDFGPDEPRRRKKKKASRSLWMGCFGFNNCVA